MNNELQYHFAYSIHFKTQSIEQIIRDLPTAVPEKPGAPEAVDWSTSHVELTWKAPAHDGGTPITGYIVEKKDKYG